MTFRLTMHPALDGDCVVLAWGTAASVHHLLVDLGRGATYHAVRSELGALANLELFVVSHIDADHIAGAIPLVREQTAPIRPNRVWFNGRPQLVAAQNRQPIHEPLSARQGEKLSRGIARFGWSWNGEFASEIVSVDSPESAQPIPLPGGLCLKLLSPCDEDLVRLLPVWNRELADARMRLNDRDEEEPPPEGDEFERFGGLLDVKRLAREPYERDTAEANGSSIAFIAEFEGKRVLLAADAHSEVLERTLKPLTDRAGGRYRLDLLKISHHGSRTNTSLEFPSMLDCTRFAISTDGSRRHKHPHAEAIARHLFADQHREKILYFNYRQPQTERWDSSVTRSRWKYRCVFPDAASNGTLTIDI